MPAALASLLTACRASGHSAPDCSRDFATAAQQGQRIYTLTKANLAQLNELTISAAAKQDIAAALNANREVTVHQNPITHAGWTGEGYIVIDPETGAGAYKISGGGNGGYVALAIFGVLIAFFSALPAAILGSTAILAAWLIPILVGASLYLFSIVALTAGWTLEQWRGFYLYMQASIMAVKFLRLLSQLLGVFPKAIGVIVTTILSSFRSDAEQKE